MLHNFNKALERHIQEIGYNKFWKWTQGKQTPSLLTWLAEHEDLIDALKRDAQERAERAGNDTTLAIIENNRRYECQ